MRRLPLIAAVAAACLLPAAALAQNANAPPNALQGFAQNRDQPIKIDAAALEVRDKNKLATFSGNVQVVQGDTTLRCRTLAVFYDQQSNGKAITTAQPGPGGQSRIRRLEARGDVVVTQKDQTATGDLGIFDMASNTVTLNGNVVVRQGQSVLRGEKLTVNLTTGEAHVEGGGKAGGGRVQGLFLPAQGGDQPQQQRPSAAPAAPAGNAATRAPARGAPRPSGLY